MSDDYCDFCDLPRSQCVHGMPRPAPTEVVKPPPRPRKRPTAPARSAATKPVIRRRTPPEVFKPLIIEVLEQAGGELDADVLFRELEIRVGDQLLPEDRETTPERELRWQYAARRARVALINEGQMIKTKPGVWQLA